MRIDYDPGPANIRRILETRGWSQRAAAREIGIAEVTLNRYASHEPRFYRPVPVLVLARLLRLPKRKVTDLERRMWRRPSERGSPTAAVAP